MCGLFGVSFCEKNQVTPVLVKGVKSVEYRGYDSFGYAVLQETNIKQTRSLKSQEIEGPLEEESSFVGIGHTRWATHGPVTINNTHPFVRGSLALAHNGTIENIDDLREKYLSKTKLEGQTDTEQVLALLDQFFTKEKSSFFAFEKTISLLKGSWGFLALCQENPTSILFARNKSPLIIGVAEEGSYIASDTLSFPETVKEVVYLKNGDYGFINQKVWVVFNDHKEVAREAVSFSQNLCGTDIEGFSTYMLKEIFQQPSVIASILENNLLDKKELDFSLWVKRFQESPCSIILLIASGSSCYAAEMGAIWLRSFSKKEVFVISADRFRPEVVTDDMLCFFISQSGETADITHKIDGVSLKNTLSLINTPHSSLERLTSFTIPLLAGPEISVASTKAFLGQMFYFLILSFAAGKVSPARWQTIERLPGLIDKVLQRVPEILQSQDLSLIDGYVIVASERNLPIALEGCLKIKEISYKESITFSFFETLPHLDKERAVVILAGESDLSVAQSIVEHALAFNSPVFVIAPEDAVFPEEVCHLPVEATTNQMFPFLATVILQLISFTAGLQLSNNIDRPRNLAKSVTVE